MARLLAVLAACAAAITPLLAEETEHDGSVHPDKLAQLCASGRHFVFTKYHASTWETEWLQNGKAWTESVCEHMVEAKDRSIEWVEGIASLRDGPNFKALQGFSPDVFSRFVYTDICAPHQPEQSDDSRGNSPQPPREIISYFEPVVGLLRHPQAGIEECLWPGAQTLSVESRDHLVPLGMTPREFKALYPGKAYFLDLGAGTSYQSSLAWFVNHYEHMGVEFEQIYGWEIQAIDEASFWGEHMDRRLASRVHLFNLPVQNDTLAVGQALQILSSVYKHGDFVAMKLDIDHEVLEGRLVQELRDSPGLRKMIGEMWFEQHHDNPMMRRFGWGEGFPYHKALETFNELRSMGLKLHTWP